MKFAFIHERKHEVPVRTLYRVLRVSESGYYSWKTTPQQRKLNDQQLLVEIRQVHHQNKGRYGAPKGHAKAFMPHVAPLMRSAGLRGKGRRKYKKTTNSKHALPVSQHLVNREFKLEQPNRLWSADLTYIPTREGCLYLTVVLDLHSRMVGG